MAFGCDLLWRLAEKCRFCCGVWLRFVVEFGCDLLWRLAGKFCGIRQKRQNKFCGIRQNVEINFAVFGKNVEINFAVFGKMLIFAHEKTYKKRRKYGVQTKTL